MLIDAEDIKAVYLVLKKRRSERDRGEVCCKISTDEIDLVQGTRRIVNSVAANVMKPLPKTSPQIPAARTPDAPRRSSKSERVQLSSARRILFH